MPVLFDQIAVLSEGSTDVVSANMTKQLDAGEALTGVPTIVEAGIFTGYVNDVAQYTVSSDLTITNKTYNAAPFVVRGKTAAIGTVAQCLVSGQQAGNTYGLRMTMTTTSTPARTLVWDALFVAK